MTDPGGLKGRAAKELYKFCTSRGGAKQGGAQLCQGTQAAFVIPSPCVAQLITQRVWFVDPVAVLLHQLRGLLPGAPWHRKGCRTAQKAEPWKPAWDNTELPRETEPQNTCGFFESPWKKIWTALCKNIFSAKKFEIRKGDVTLIVQSGDKFTLLWKSSTPRKFEIIWINQIC